MSKNKTMCLARETTQPIVCDKCICSKAVQQIQIYSAQREMGVIKVINTWIQKQLLCGTERGWTKRFYITIAFDRNTWNLGMLPINKGFEKLKRTPSTGVGPKWAPAFRVTLCCAAYSRNSWQYFKYRWQLAMCLLGEFCIQLLVYMHGVF
jgi:hypothetical protein